MYNGKWIIIIFVQTECNVGPQYIVSLQSQIKIRKFYFPLYSVGVLPKNFLNARVKLDWSS